MSPHKSAVFVWAVCTLAAAPSAPWIFCASRTEAQERKNIGQQQREDSLKADEARKSGEMGTQPSVSPDTGAARGLNSTNPMQSIQEALKANGHDPGPIDGVMGRRTQDALRAYQAAQHLKVTGRIDEATAAKLGIRPAARNP